MSGECILVIDDSRETVKHLTERVLPTFGYKTLFAYDGQSGLKLIRENSPDLIMLDYNLPEMTGIDVLRQMAQESLSTPVVLMTGYGSELSAIEAFRLGAKDYLIKPFTVDEIADTIDRALVETRLQHDKQELAEQLRRTKVELSRLGQEMDTLFSIGKAITSLLSVDQVLERVLEAAMYLTSADDSAIWLIDDSGERLRLYERRGLESNGVEREQLVESSQVGQVVRTGRPLRQSFFTGRGVKLGAGTFARAIMYMPLNLRGVTMGVLEVSNQEARRSFSRRDEFLLSFLADYAAIALENARVFQAADLALSAGLDELSTLIDITRAITATLDLDEVVRLTIHLVHNSWNIEASSLWLLDETRQQLRVLANVGTPYDVLSQFEVPLGKGFVGYVAETGKWIYTNQVADHELHFRDVDVATGFSTRSILSVPLLFGGRVIGALQLLNKLDGDFDDRDVERAISIGAAVAIAVTNALLFEEAETRKEQLGAILDNTENPTLILDEHDQLILLNQQARVRLGLSKEMVGRPIFTAVSWDELPDILGRETAESYQEEITLSDGAIYQVRVTPLPDQGRILTLQDNVKLQELNKLKDHFVATISHDMRSPLNTVMAFATGLGDMGPLNERQEYFVNTIVKSTRVMLDIVNGLLELAKVDALKQTYQPCDIRQIIDSVLNEFQERTLEKAVSVHVHAAKPMPKVIGDPGQLRSALGNLLDNAIKYSPQGGEVRVTVTAVAKEIVVEFHDHGQGIPLADMPHVFEKFFRGTNVGSGIKGVGLGLALVESVAKAHGGRVWVESDEGVGSRFFFSLPLLTALFQDD
ncbi:MAG: GAF domain-containing protein [Anaerolineales bacterium]|nr:GAF domain-containing protein [Anaerolineales bacterium]